MNELYNLVFELAQHDYVITARICNDILEMNKKYGKNGAIEKFREFIDDYKQMINNQEYYDPDRIRRCEDNIWYWNIAIIAVKKEENLIRKNKLIKIKKDE